jgi:soluble lytic murein transglycosylase-like protein
MARKTRTHQPANEPSVRTAKEKMRSGRSWMRYFWRALFVLSILVNLFILSRPGVLEFLSNRLEARLESSGGYDTHGGVTRGDAELANLFTQEVLYWQDELIRWGQERNINPNLLATIMQIESCGDPYVSSHAGAQGLFQVMPLHFENGQNQINPETNAQSGIDHLVDCLVWTDYDVVVSLACYNGGPSVIGLDPSQWFQETQSYARWGGGIYADAAQGEASSPTLNEWLTAGGTNLCQRARFTQDFVMPNAVVSQP